MRGSRAPAYLAGVKSGKQGVWGMFLGSQSELVTELRLELRALDSTAQDVGRTLQLPPPCQAGQSLAVGAGRLRR